MLDQQVYSITKWAQKVASDSLLFDICGFSDKVPSVASYYDFLVRLWMADDKIHINRKLKARRFISKPKKKLKAGQKQPLKSFIADGAMDNYPAYDLLKHYDMLPFISLDSKTKAKFNYPHPDILCFDDKGSPICMGGIPSVSW